MDAQKARRVLCGLANTRLRLFHAAQNISAALTEYLAFTCEGQLTGGSMNKTYVEPLFESHEVSAGCRH